jgi:two-component system, chemotaxis family, sensor kinase CheA
LDNGFLNEPMLDIFIYETTQNIEQLEKLILASEESGSFSSENVNEIFRIMHTIKGSSAMMLFNNLASLAHAVEDLFYYIREEKPEHIDHAALSDIVLEGVDFIKLELEKVKNADGLDGDPAGLVENIKGFLSTIKGEEHPAQVKAEKKEEAPAPQQYYLSPKKGTSSQSVRGYEAVFYFDEGCEMENIRAYAIVQSIKEISEEFHYYPEDIIENNDSVQIIRDHGFKVRLKTDKGLTELHEFFMNTPFVRDIELTELNGDQASEAFVEPEKKTVQAPSIQMPKVPEHEQEQADHGQAEKKNSHQQQNIISVDVAKLDILMDLMGEMVIAEAMVTQNPELQNLQLNSFYKAARQLRKITGEMQDMVMSIRMVPLSATFHKMHRIVRDMGRKLDKEVQLTLIGEETEVDKNIIEHISDPLMHLVRNAVDHGVESPDERTIAGKARAGQVTLEAKNAGSDVIVTVRDDGKGLDKQKILAKAAAQGLLTKPKNEMLDREIYNLIFLPGFSTNESVTEFSGRGVGMDVVIKNLEAIGGSVSIDSVQGSGTVTTLKIPLTLAIIDGMNIRVGNAKYTLPTTSIAETFQAKEKDIVKDPDGNEMIMVRGECYPILRLHKLYAVKTDIIDLTRGIMLMVEQDGRSMCLFADELLGQHQVVVKALPNYIKNTKKVDGLAGCTLLGDGSISLILNIGGLINM